MKKLKKTTERLSHKRLIAVAIIMALVVITSSGVLYWNSQSFDTKKMSQCEGVTYSTSADGLVVVSEADLRCAGENKSGVSIEQAQYQICQGTYGGKTWSTSEREAACVRYEDLTGRHLQNSGQSSSALFIYLPLAFCVLLAVLGYMVYRKSSRRKSAKKG